MIKNGCTIETHRQQLLERLNDQKSSRERNRWGQFATPLTLANQIVAASLELLPKRGPIRFIEPGFGTGPFYSALRNKTSRVAMAKGIELDPLFATAARNLWKGTGLRIVQHDFTRLSPPTKEATKFELIICNPPYVRHHHIDAVQKGRLQQQVSDSIDIHISGLAGLYSHFMLLSQQWMTKGGIGAWLVPGEFMDVNYGDAVKEFLIDRVTLHRIHRFDPAELQFDDALVSSVVVFFQNSLPPARHHVLFSQGGSVDRPSNFQSINTEQLRTSKKWTRVVKQNGVPNEASLRLSDLFTIKRGIATGCNKFFVLTEQRAVGLKLPRRFLKPILPSPRYLKTDQIKSRPDGSPAIDDRRFLLNCSKSIEQIRQESQPLFDYLAEGQRARVHQGYLCRNRDPWYLQEDRSPAPFLCTYMGRTNGHGLSPFRFIMNRSTAIAANVYLLLYPKPELAAKLNDDCSFQSQVFLSLQSIRAEALIGEGRAYGGGLHKVEPKELANVRFEMQD